MRPLPVLSGKLVVDRDIAFCTTEAKKRKRWLLRSFSIQGLLLFMAIAFVAGYVLMPLENWRR